MRPVSPEASETLRAAAATKTPLACGNCGQPMRPLALAGHYGSTVEIDLCAPCHLVWFDGSETANLSGPALLDLIGAMAAAHSLPHEVLRPQLACARCHGPVKTVHNQSRWGRSLQLGCLARHGAYQSFAQFLGEKGLLRPMSSVDRTRLLKAQGHIDCVNCGAPIGAKDNICPHCDSVPSLLDVARLAQALDPEGVLAPHPVHALAAQQAALQCGACGAALPPGQDMRCAQCGATLAVSRLAQAHEAVATLAPALRAHALRPAPAVVKKRLEALDADLPRRREWVAAVEAETRQRRGHDGELWTSWLSGETNPWRAIALALALWFAWWFWH